MFSPWLGIRTKLAMKNLVFIVLNDLGGARKDRLKWSVVLLTLRPDAPLWSSLTL